VNLISLQWIIAKDKETHPYHCEYNADSAKDSPGWCDTREILREIQALDNHIQRGEDIVASFRLFGPRVHGLKVRVGAKGRCSGQAMGKAPSPWTL